MSTILVAHPGTELYGSDRMLLESVAGLRRHGHDVVVALPADGPLATGLRATGATVVRCPSPVLRKRYLSPTGLPLLAWQTLRAAPAGWRLLRRTRPDAVLVNTITVPLWLVLARLARRPLVCHVHEAEGSAGTWVRRALALPVRAATAVICNSRFSQRVLTDAAPGLAARTTVVHNGVPGPADPTPPRESLDGPIRLLYLGRLSERKGVDVAVAALATLRERGTDARLDVVGAVFDGYEWFEDDLRRTVTDRGLGEHVTLHGFHPDIWGHLDAADVLLVPSRADEPFGNTAVEGALAARAVVASATTGLLEAVEGLQAARSVRPGDPAAIADAVEDLTADWARTREHALADRKYAADRYSPVRYGDLVTAAVRDAPAP